MNKTLKKVTCIVSAVSFIAMFICLLKQPATLPSHWNASGEADAYASKYIYQLFTLLPVALVFGVDSLPNSDPDSTERNIKGGAYSIIMSIVAFVFGCIPWVGYLTATKPGVNNLQLLMVILGIMLIAIGCNIKDVKQNSLLGVRTPWTLKSEFVWEETHKKTQYVMIAEGIVVMALAFIKSAVALYLMAASIVVMALGLAFYSYSLYQKVK